MSNGTQNHARIIAVVGKSGSGKGLCVKGEIIKQWRGAILVWSPLESTDDYTAVIRGIICASIEQVVSAIKKGHKRIVLEPGQNVPSGTKPENWLKTQFDRFCRISWELSGWMIVVEELSRVTQASWSPAAWKNICTAGRHRGLTVVGTCQRPAQVDKDFFGNCSEIRCYKVGFIADAKAMADVMFCDFREILSLERLHYIHRDVDDNQNRAGIAKIPKKR
jgi:hypothetical protein